MKRPQGVPIWFRHPFSSTALRVQVHTGDLLLRVEVTAATHGRGATDAGVLFCRVLGLLRRRDDRMQLPGSLLPSGGRVVEYVVKTLHAEGRRLKPRCFRFLNALARPGI